MSQLKRIVPLLLAVLLSACINLPEVAEPESPDAGGTPDAGSTPDAGTPADSTPPTITTASPLHGSTNVPTNTQWVLTFSEPMNVTTVQFSIAPTVALSASTWTNGNTQLTLQPAAPLSQNTTYTLVVDGKDLAGKALADRKAFSFSTTGPAPDTTPPTVLSFSPAYAAIGVARDAVVTVTFSEPMDKASAQTAFAITSPPGFKFGVFGWNAAGTEMTFNPDTDFAYGTEVIWSVATTAKDLSGNALENNVTSTFRAVRQNTVTLDFDVRTSGNASAPDYWRNGGAYNFESVGDWFGDSQNRLLLGFKLDALPEELTHITSSRLKWYITGQRGTPFAVLGRLLLERVYIGETIAYSGAESVNPDAKVQYESPALNPPIIVPSNAITTMGTFDVTSFVTQDWADRGSRNTKRSQFRLRFEVPSDNDSAYDDIYSDVEQTPKLAELEVTYEYP
ncbi:MAG: Ig-like domain-containing protein [Hyalangium sp.]|uniref:Ig-like domain-containing protein n=1 Tax=Hyalangium sp. TaxID=2028555 RepID=UPI00389AE7F1